MGSLGKSSLLFLFLFFISFTALAADLYVATDGTNSGDCTDSESPCLTVQYAINQSSDNDTVHVGAGTFTENISFNGKSITIDGEGSSKTILDGDASSHVVYILSLIHISEPTRPC